MNLKELIARISEDDLKSVLDQMSVYDEFHTRIEKIVNDELKEEATDVNGIADDVKAALESIDAEELFDRSGPRSSGYVDPNEEAWEMFEEEVQEFAVQLKEYCDNKLFDEAMQYCMGILLGLYRFEKESSTDFKDWAADAPGSSFGDILEDWRKQCPTPEMSEEMDSFLKEHCPDFMKA